METLGAPWPGAAGVSGGGDSVALMLLLAEWAKAHEKPAPVVLTVDHGLRKGSLKDARDVARRANAAGLKAHVLRWRGAKPGSDIEAVARDARYGLMGAWCRKHRMAGLYLAHTLEDQAETFLLRLARGSGIDGLSAMSAVAPFPQQGCQEISLIRPLLGFHRRVLREYLEVRGESWIEDPMNGDPRFARARLRAAWPDLERIGLSASRIAAAAHHLGRARQALDADAEALIAAGCRFDTDAARFDADLLAQAPTEVGLRALAAVLMRVSGQIYRPRFERLVRLYGMIRSGQLRGGRTLHGCRIGPAGKLDACFGPHTLLITREKSGARARGSDAKSANRPKSL